MDICPKRGLSLTARKNLAQTANLKPKLLLFTVLVFHPSRGAICHMLGAPKLTQTMLFLHKHIRVRLPRTLYLGLVYVPALFCNFLLSLEHLLNWLLIVFRNQLMSTCMTCGTVYILKTSDIQVNQCSSD